MTGGDLILLRPLWLVGIPAALFLGALAARSAHGLAAWQRITDPALLAALRARGQVTEPTRDPAPWLLAMAAALVAAGLSGPATRDRDAPILRNLDAVMILLDLSPSVTEGGGLDDAQAAVSRLIDTHGTRPVALGVYTSESFLVSVPTEDPAALQTVVAVADAQTMPLGGSRPDRALTMARQVLSDAAAARPDVVLISDGGGVGPEALDLARRMAAEGLRVSTIFVGPEGAPYGMPPVTPEALEDLARAGGGIMTAATDLSGLEAFLDERRGDGATDPALRNLRYADHGPWLLAVALLPLALLFRRRRPA